MSLRDLGAFITRYVAPPFRDAKFQRRGRTFIKRNETNDMVLARIASFSDFETRRFHVEVAYIPRLAWTWRQECFGVKPSSVPHETDGLWRGRLLPHPDTVNAELGDWAYTDEASARGVGLLLETALSEELIPWLEGMLDRSKMIRRFDEPVMNDEYGWWWADPPVAKAFLLLDEGPSPEADALLEFLEDGQMGPVEFLTGHYRSSH